MSTSTGGPQHEIAINQLSGKDKAAQIMQLHAGFCGRQLSLPPARRDAPMARTSQWAGPCFPSPLLFTVARAPCHNAHAGAKRLLVLVTRKYVSCRPPKLRKKRSTLGSIDPSKSK